MLGASVSKSFGNGLSFFSSLLGLLFAAQRSSRVFHEFVFAWHVFCFAEKLRESNFQLRRFTQQFVQ